MSDTLEAGILGAGAAIVGAIIGGTLSGILQEVFSWFRRPILDIQFEDCSAKQPESPFMTYASWEDEAQQRQWVIARARVRNTGRR